MPINKNIEYIHEPTPLQCGQAVLAMLTGLTTEKICELTETTKETTLKQMFYVLDYCGIEYEKQRIEITQSTVLPNICILSLETPKCWHWSLYFNGKFYDPEYGLINEFPPSNRKYYWRIKT